jgi:two-component system, OmpR family, response regulator
MRALLIEDDKTIADFVVRGLREAGFAVDHEADGEAGLEAALRQPYDVAIVDLMLPRRDGLSVIDALRKRGKTTPVLILSAKRSVDDRVKACRRAATITSPSRSRSRSFRRASRRSCGGRRGRRSRRR